MIILGIRVKKRGNKFQYEKNITALKIYKTKIKYEYEIDMERLFKFWTG